MDIHERYPMYHEVVVIHAEGQEPTQVYFRPGENPPNYAARKYRAAQGGKNCETHLVAWEKL